MRIRSYINETCSGMLEVCYYDADKYFAPEDYDEENPNNAKELPFAFGNELSIESYETVENL